MRVRQQRQQGAEEASIFIAASGSFLAQQASILMKGGGEKSPRRPFFFYPLIKIEAPMTALATANISTMDRLALPNENDPKYRLPNGRFNNDMFQTDLRDVEEHNERVYLQEAEAPIQKPVVLKNPELTEAVKECKKLIKSDHADVWLQLSLDVRQKIHSATEKIELVQTRLEHKAATTKSNAKLQSKMTYATQQTQASENRIEKVQSEKTAWTQKTQRQTAELEASIELLDEKLKADIQSLQNRHAIEVAKIRERIESKQKKLEGHLIAFEADQKRSKAYVDKLKEELNEMKSATTILPDKTDYVQLATLKKDLLKLYTRNTNQYDVCATADLKLETALCTHYGREIHKLTEEMVSGAPWVRESETLGDYEMKHSKIQSDLRAVLNQIEEMMGGASLSDIGSLSSSSSSSSIIANEVVYHYSEE